MRAVSVFETQTLTDTKLNSAFYLYLCSQGLSAHSLMALQEPARISFFFKPPHLKYNQLFKPTAEYFYNYISQ